MFLDVVIISSSTLFFVMMILYRYKQTQQESKTLTVVNQELSKLDNMISSEISVLREKIEEANRQYNAARYCVCVCVWGVHVCMYKASSCKNLVTINV